MKLQMIAAACAVLMLSSCAPTGPTPQDFSDNERMCKGMGYTGERMMPCMEMLFRAQGAAAQQAANDRRDRFARAAMIMQATSPPPPTIRHTTCNRFGSQLNCTTF